MIVVIKKTFVDALNTSDIRSTNFNFVSSRREWFFRNRKVDSFPKEKIFPVGNNCAQIKLALKNNDIESQKNLACFQIYGTVFYKGELQCLQGCFRKQTDKEGI